MLGKLAGKLGQKNGNPFRISFSPNFPADTDVVSNRGLRPQLEKPGFFGKAGLLKMSAESLVWQEYPPLVKGL